MKLRAWVIPGPTEWSSTNPSSNNGVRAASSLRSARFQTRYTIFNTSRHRSLYQRESSLCSVRPPLSNSSLRFPVADQAKIQSFEKGRKDHRNVLSRTENFQVASELTLLLLALRERESRKYVVRTVSFARNCVSRND